jgi:hypothetical protein
MQSPANEGQQALPPNLVTSRLVAANNNTVAPTGLTCAFGELVAYRTGRGPSYTWLEAVNMKFEERKVDMTSLTPGGHQGQSEC